MASLQDDHDAVVERFEPTSGQVTGWMPIGLAAVLAVPGVVSAAEGLPLWVAATGLLVAVLAWAAMIRPALWATHEHLVMRNLVETVHIRLAAVEEMAIRQVLAVRVGERRFVSTVVGRTWRKTLQSRHRPGGLADKEAVAPTEGLHYARLARAAGPFRRRTPGAGVAAHRAHRGGRGRAGRQLLPLSAAAVPGVGHHRAIATDCPSVHVELSTQ